MSTPNLDLPLVTESQAGKYITLNTALMILDKWMGGVISRSSSGPPGSPTEGDGYIVDLASGDWSGFTVGDVVVYYVDSTGSAAWVAATPIEGPLVYVSDDSTYVKWSGSLWQPVAAVSPIIDVSATKTLAISDLNSIQRVTAAATLTIPLDSAVDFPIGSQVTVRRATASAVTFQGDGGVTVNGSLTLASQNDSVTAVKVGADEWDAY